MSLPPENPQQLIEFYAKILDISDDKLKNVVVSKSLPDTGSGDGLGRELGPGKEFVTIEFKEDGKQPLELFLKKRPAAPEEAILFDKEVFFYSVFLPDALVFVDLRDEFKEVPLAEMFAKCYHAESNMIILENVLKKGFVMTPINRPHTFYQAEKVLERLGMFHAVSYVMIKELGLEEFQKKYAPLVEENIFSAGKKDSQNKNWETTLEMALTILKETPVEGSDAACKFLKKYKGKLFAELCEQVKSRSEDVLTTLNFGDVWNGNIFVSRDEEKQVYPGAILINPKMARIGSPMLDVSCYMYSCVAEHIRFTNYKFLLDVFFEFIRDKSQELGIEFEMDFAELKVLYIGKSVTGIFRAMNFLFHKFYCKPSQLTEDNLDFEKFENWLKENPELSDSLALEIVSKIHQYERCLQELAELE